MKNTTKAGIAGLGIAAAMIVGIGPAHANVEGDLNDHSSYAYALTLNEDGVPETVAAAVNLALTVCTDRSEGISEDRLQDQATPASASIDIVDDAEFHFCPGYEMSGVVPGVPLWVPDPSASAGWITNPVVLAAERAQGTRV